LRNQIERKRSNTEPSLEKRKSLSGVGEVLIPEEFRVIGKKKGRKWGSAR